MKYMIIQTQKTVYKVNIDDIYYIQTHFSEKKVNTLSSMPDVAIEKFVKNG